VVFPWGCSRQTGHRTLESTPQATNEIFFAEVLRVAEIGNWRAAYQPQTGEGLEGLTQLVDGAAEQLWQQGVGRAVFQEFTREGGQDALEFQLYLFRAGEQAAGYLQEECREARAFSCSDCGCARACVLAGDFVSQAVVGLGNKVLVVRVHVGREAAGPLLDRLVRASARLGCELTS
jgi:hypothetical protein